MCLVTNDGHSLVQAAKEAVKPHPLLLSALHHQLNTKGAGTANTPFDSQSSSTMSTIPQTPNQTLLSDCKRVKWTEELHQTFLDAVHKLGKNAIPSQIKQVMNVPNLTREQVASHLQKYRKLFPFLRSSREEIKLNVCEPACLEEVVSLANHGNQHQHHSGFPRSTAETLRSTEACLNHTQGLSEQKSNEAREHFNGKFQMKPLDGFTGTTFFEAGVFTEPSSTFTASEDTSHQTVDPDSLSDTSSELKRAEVGDVNSLSEVVEKELFSAVTHKSFYTNSFLSVFEELVDKIQPQLDPTEITTPATCQISITDPDSLLFYPSSSKNGHHSEKKDEIIRREDGSSDYYHSESSKKKRKLDDYETTVDASFYVNSFYQLPLPQHQAYFELATTASSSLTTTTKQTTVTMSALT